MSRTTRFSFRFPFHLSFRRPEPPRGGRPGLVAAAVLWGTGGLLGALLADRTGLGPLAVATDRLLVGGALVLGWLLLRRTRLPRGRAAHLRILLVGALSAIYQGGYFLAITLTSVSLATLINIGAVPVIVLAVECLRGRRRPDGLVLTVVVLALLGLGLLVGVPVGGRGLEPTLLGAACATVSAAAFAATTMIVARPVRGLDGLATTAYGLVAGGVLLAPAAALVGGLGFPVTTGALVYLVALGLGPTAGAYCLYFGGLGRVDATTAGVLTLIEPLTSTVLAALVLGDRLGPVGVAGAVLLAVAVAVAARRADR